MDSHRVGAVELPVDRGRVIRFRSENRSSKVRSAGEGVITAPSATARHNSETASILRLA
ncbi:protein of unknown function [Agreia sp. COWG]|nr:protein of unknown function [Agreia sp. COWG]